MKTISKVLLLSLTITGLSYSMDNKLQKEREESFKTNVAMLSKSIADFVNDFKTWPKEEQDKIEIFTVKGVQGFQINGRPAASGKYDGSIGFYLDCRLSQRQIAPFLSALDYLKQQKSAQ